MATKKGPRHWREILRDRSSNYRRAKRELSQRFLGVPVRGNAIRDVKVAPDILANLVAIGVAEKRSDRVLQDHPAITFYVKEKVPRSMLTRRMTLPRTIDGLTCDVVACGRTRPALGEPPGSTMIDPPGPGAQIQVPGANPGTLGAIIRDGNGNACLISNCHVLSGDLASGVGMPVFQPQLSAIGSREIATVTQVIPLRDQHTNWADVAIARLTAEASAEIPSVGFLTGVGEPEDGMPVVKYGFRTGLQEAFLESIDTDFQQAYGLRNMRFKEVHVYLGDGFADLGDSGSVIVDATTRQAVGLFFATGQGLHFSIPMSSIARELPDLIWA
jgi:hypothetical protein